MIMYEKKSKDGWLGLSAVIEQISAVLSANSAKVLVCNTSHIVRTEQTHDLNIAKLFASDFMPLLQGYSIKIRGITTKYVDEQGIMRQVLQDLRPGGRLQLDTNAVPVLPWPPVGQDAYIVTKLQYATAMDVTSGSQGKAGATAEVQKLSTVRLSARTAQVSFYGHEHIRQPRDAHCRLFACY